MPMASECIAGELDCRLFELYDEYGLALRIGLLCLGVQLACATLEQGSLVATFANTLLMVSTLGVLWHLACADSGHAAALHTLLNRFWSQMYCVTNRAVCSRGGVTASERATRA